MSRSREAARTVGRAYALKYRASGNVWRRLDNSDEALVPSEIRTDEARVSLENAFVLAAVEFLLDDTPMPADMRMKSYTITVNHGLIFC